MNHRCIFIVGLLLIICSTRSVQAQESGDKTEILRARLIAQRAADDRQFCAKLSFPDNTKYGRCIQFYPSKLIVWGKGFYEGRAKVTINGKSGFIDIKGELVIPASYRDVGSFSEGLAPFENLESKWGFLDRAGNIVISPRYDWAISFSEGLALVQEGELWGYIDKTGSYVIPPRFDEASSFSERFAAIQYYDGDVEWMGATPRKGKWVSRFIDKNGNTAIQGDFDHISRGFDGGMAIVSRSLGYSTKHQGMIVETYVMDASGHDLWKLDSPTITWFSDGVIVVETVRNRNGLSLYNFRLRNGQLLCDKDVEDPTAFSEGLAAVRVKERYGFIDKRCKFAVRPQFRGAKGFSEGLAAVEDDNSRWGYIDKNGTVVIRPKFKWAMNFNNGFALILDGSKAGYIDRVGNVVWEPSE